MDRRCLLAVLAVSALSAGRAFQIRDRPPCSYPYSEYAIVVDGGSTGSRLFVFNISYSDEPVEVRPTKGPKVTPGLSAYVGETTGTKVTEYLVDLFMQAKPLIPERFHRETRVYIKATAGMRLTSVENQEKTYDQIYEGVSTHENFTFSLDRADIGTISGDSEGLFAGISVNYLANRVAGDLTDKGFRSHGTLGALDMGGGSSQIVFQPRNVSSKSNRLSTDNFWSHSYLGYGVDQIRLLVWAFLAEDYKADQAPQLGSTAAAETDGKPLPIVQNPCGFRGHVQHWEAVALHGTGDSEACSDLLRKLVFGESCKRVRRVVNLGPPSHPLEAVEPVARPKKLASEQYPPCEMDDIVVPSTRGMEFYAMSVYFFALNAVFTLVPEKLKHEGKEDAEVDEIIERWPNPSITDLRNIIDDFCAINWATLKELPKHGFTAPDQLSHRCVEVNWIVEMLSSGYAIPDDARSITYAFKLSGMEVEWTLGFILSLVSRTDKVRTCRLPTVNATQDDVAKVTAIGSAALAAEPST